MTVPQSPLGTAGDSVTKDGRNRIARLERPHSFFDFLKKEYEVNLLLDGDATIRTGSPLLSGVHIDMDWLESGGTAVHPKILELLRELKPTALRRNFGGDGSKILSFLTLCRRVGAEPYLSFDIAKLEPSALIPVLNELRTAKNAGDFETVYVELDVREFISKANGSVETAAARVVSFSETLRSADLDPRLILSGVDLLENFSRLWFQNLISVCADSVDQIGVSWAIPGEKAAPSDASTVDSAVIYAGAVERLVRLTKKLYTDIPEPLTKPVVLTSWAYVYPDQTNHRASAFYIATVLDALAAEPRFTLQCLDLSAMLTRTANGDWTETSSAFALRLHQNHFARRISWRVVREEPLPSAHSDGLPGIVDPFEVPDVAMSASRSEDRTQIRLIAQNRHPRKRLYLRVHFANLPDMRPTRAQVIRAGSGTWPRRYFENQDSTPTLKTLGMPKYRPMDHVNIDLPPLGLIQMELTNALP